MRPSCSAVTLNVLCLPFTVWWQCLQRALLPSVGPAPTGSRPSPPQLVRSREMTHPGTRLHLVLKGTLDTKSISVIWLLDEENSGVYNYVNNNFTGVKLYSFLHKLMETISASSMCDCASFSLSLRYLKVEDVCCSLVVKMHNVNAFSL